MATEVGAELVVLVFKFDISSQAGSRQIRQGDAARVSLDQLADALLEPLAADQAIGIARYFKPGCGMGSFSCPSKMSM